MVHQADVLLSDDTYAALKAASDDTGLPVPELIRRAVESVYHPRERTEVLGALHSSFAAWTGRSFDGASYTVAVRTPRPRPRLRSR